MVSLATFSFPWLIFFMNRYSFLLEAKARSNTRMVQVKLHVVSSPERSYIPQGGILFQNSSDVAIVICSRKSLYWVSTIVVNDLIARLAQRGYVPFQIYYVILVIYSIMHIVPHYNHFITNWNLEKVIASD